MTDCSPIAKIAAKTAEWKACQQRREQEARTPTATPRVFACHAIQTARELALTEPVGMSGKKVSSLRKLTAEGGCLTDAAVLELPFQEEEDEAKKDKKRKPAPKGRGGKQSSRKGGTWKC